MTSPSGSVIPAAPVGSANRSPPSGKSNTPPPVLSRLALTAALLVVYYWQRQTIVAALQSLFTSATGEAVAASSVAAWIVAAIIVVSIAIWRKVLAKDKRFHAPLLVTCILIMGDTAFSILENHPSKWLAEATNGALSTYSPTFIAILAAVVTEIILGRFFYGKWPHLASAYVSGISAGILIKSPELWPFIFCSMISITSKYALRVGDRHLWNPTNFGMTAMLFLTNEGSLSVQAGNELWAAVVIWLLGGMILFKLGRLHIPIAFFLAFIPLSYLRSVVDHHRWVTELAPITSPMFQLYIFFMITDPKTTTKSKWSQSLVAILVAIVETVYRLVFHDVHSLYHALFTIGPITNLIEIVYYSRRRSCRHEEACVNQQKSCRLPTESFTLPPDLKKDS